MIAALKARHPKALRHGRPLISPHLYEAYPSNARAFSVGHARRQVAGIRPGDLLLENGGREVRPPNDLTFSVCESANLLIEKLHGEVQKVNVQLPMPKSQKHPVTAPQAVTTEKFTTKLD